ncbi:MAG: hypothetical protein PVF45_03440, partial [Anaerolineae bacterium]
AARLDLSPSSDTITAGQGRSYTAAAYDQDDNLVGDVTASTTFDIDPAAGGSWGSNTYTSEKAGTWTVEGSYTNAQSQVVTGTASLTVLAGPLATINLIPDPVTVEVGDTQIFTATGFDAYGNRVSLTPDWSSDVGSMVGNTTGLTATATLNARTSPAPATGSVTAEQGSVDDSAVVNLVSGPLTTLSVTPDAATVEVGTTQPFAATGADQYGNPVSVSPSWEASNGGVSPASGPSTVFTAQTNPAPDAVTVTATQGAASDVALVSIVAGPVETIDLVPNPVTVEVGTTQVFTATGVDEFGNRVPLTPTWDSDVGSMADYVNGYTATATLTAQTTPAPDSGTVSAEQGSASDSATVNIVAGPLASLSVTPDPATVMVGTSRLFAVTGVDQYGNPVSVSPLWDTNGGSIDPGPGDSSLFTAQTTVATGRQVTATEGSVVDTAVVDIPHGPLQHFTILPLNIATQVAGVDFELTIEAKDEYGNLATSYNGQADLSDSTGTLLPAQVTFTDGLWTGDVNITEADENVIITVSDGVTTGVSNAFTVLPAALHHFTLSGYPSSVVAGAGFGSNDVVVTAYDEYNNVKTNYTGAVYFESDDPQAVFFYDDGNPYNFVSGDQGTHTFYNGSWFELRTTGVRHLTVTDGAISRSSTGITVNPAALARFEMSGYPTAVTAGEPWSGYTVLVTAYDAYDNVKTDYDGDVHFESDDPQAVLTWDDSNPYTFSPGTDQGAHSFDGNGFELRRTVIRHITVVNETGTVSEQSAIIVVNPADLDEFVIVPLGDQVAGDAFQLNVTALDRWDNYKTDYAGLPNLSDSTGTILPTNTDAGCFVSTGICEQTVVITRAMQDVRITVADVGEGVSEQSNAFDVSQAALDHIRINSAPDNGGQSYGYPIEVGNRTMDIYQTFDVWAAGYDRFDNYRQDLVVTWGLTGILAAGGIAPTPAISATFTPAPVLSGTGTITAAYDELTDSTGIFTIQAPWLVIKKIGPDVPVPAGTFNMMYTIVYTNVGTAPAKDIIITDTYDNNVSYAWASPPNDHSSGFDVVWTETEDLEVNVPYYKTLLVNVADSLLPNTILTNLVEIGGPRIETHAFTETTVVTSTPELSVSLSDLGNDPVGAGSDFILDVTFTNDGSAPVHNVVFSLTLDPHLTFQSATADPAIPPTPATNNVGEWRLATLNGNSDYSFNLTVKVDDFMQDGYVMFHQGIIDSDEEGPAYATEPTTVNAPELELTQASTPRPAVAFSSLTFTLSYSNVGRGAAEALTIADVVPANTDYESCSPLPCSESGGIVTWQFGGLSAESSGTVEMVVDVHRNLDSGTVLTNQARIQVISAPAYSATTQITTTVVSTPELSLAISNGKTSVEATEDVIYTVSYTNTGSGRAYSTTIVVTPPSPQYVGSTNCLPGACTSEDGKLIYELGTVDGGESGSVRMFVHISDTLPAGMHNAVASASISTITPGDDPAGNAAQDVDAISTRPDLEIQTDYLHHTPYPGQRLTYTLRYSNTGRIVSTGVVVTFTKPHYTTFDASDSSAWQDLGDGHYAYELGALGYNENGTLWFVVIMPTGTFTMTMNNFDASVGISDDGYSGDDADPADNWQYLPQGVPDILVQDVEVNWETLLSGQYGTHVTVTIRNEGAAWACNSVPPPPPTHTPGLPYYTGFWVDVYMDPDELPVSYPSDRNYSNVGAWLTVMVPPEATTTVFFSFALPPSGTLPSPLYVRLDNLETRPHGSVWEYNEWNNLYGPIYVPFSLYLPLVMRSP